MGVSRGRPLAVWSVLILSLCAATANAADAPARKPRTPQEVAAAVDAAFDASWRSEKVTPAPLSADAEFLRRVCLDITGRLPSVKQATAFLDSKDADKRAKLIDELLAAPEYGRHFGRIWRNLMVRPDANMPNPPNTEPLADWLAARFNENRGWDKTVAELLQAEGPDASAPGTFFILNGDGRGNPLANVTAGSVSKLFMGLQFECAECHKHPFADWKQTDFWGLAAFFGHVNLVGKSGVTEDRKAKNFKRSITIATGPKASIVIPTTSFKMVGEVVRAKFPGGPELTEGVDGPLRPAFAKWLTTAENPYFASNATNRLLGHFFGRHLVEGQLDPAEESVHAQVLKALARELGESGFDQKHLIRCLCNSKTYQRAARPAGKGKDVPFAQAAQRVLAPEVLYDALCSALEVADLTGGKRGTGPTRAEFLRAFTTRPEGGDPTEYAYGIPQALALINQPVFNGGGKIVDRLMQASKSPGAVVEGLYLAALSRRPSAEELADAIAFVDRRKSSRDGYAEVLWALLNSAEFVVNH